MMLRQERGGRDMAMDNQNNSRIAQGCSEQLCSAGIGDIDLWVNDHNEFKDLFDSGVMKLEVENTFITVKYYPPKDNLRPVSDQTHYSKRFAVTPQVRTTEQVIGVHRTPLIVRGAPPTRVARHRT